MKGFYVKETCNASLKQFAIGLEDEKGQFDIMLVVNMEKGPIDHIIMQSCLEYINTRYKKYQDFGPMAVSVLAPARRNPSNMWLDTYVRNFRKKKTQSARENLQS